jgi:hypothetical protein
VTGFWELSLRSSLIARGESERASVVNPEAGGDMRPILDLPQQLHVSSMTPALAMNAVRGLGAVAETIPLEGILPILARCRSPASAKPLIHLNFRRTRKPVAFETQAEYPPKQLFAFRPGPWWSAPWRPSGGGMHMPSYPGHQ